MFEPLEYVKLMVTFILVIGLSVHYLSVEGWATLLVFLFFVILAMLVL